MWWETSRFVLLSAALALATVGMGCSVVSPPPMMARHAGAAPMSVGSKAVTVIGGGAGGLFLDAGVGGAGRLSYQATEEVQLSGDLTTGWNMNESQPDDKLPANLFSGGLRGQFNPSGSQWLAMSLGFGGGQLDTGLLYATMDGSFTLSYQLFGVITPYISPGAAVSVPLVQGEKLLDTLDEHDGVPRHPETTYYFGGHTGLVVNITPELSLSADLGILVGESPGEDHEEGAAIVSLTGGLRYEF